MKQDRAKYQDEMATAAFTEDSLPKGRASPFRFTAVSNFLLPISRSCAQENCSF